MLVYRNATPTPQHYFNLINLYTWVERRTTRRENSTALTAWQGQVSNCYTAAPSPRTNGSDRQKISPAVYGEKISSQHSDTEHIRVHQNASVLLTQKWRLAEDTWPLSDRIRTGSPFYDGSRPRKLNEPYPLFTKTVPILSWRYGLCRCFHWTTLFSFNLI